METELAITKEVIALLRCPETEQSLHLADHEELAYINAQGGEALKMAFVVEDGSRAYPVDDGFPILLLERAIPLVTR